MRRGEKKCTQITHTNVDRQFQLFLHQRFLDALREARIARRSLALGAVVDETTYFDGILLFGAHIAICIHDLLISSAVLGRIVFFFHFPL